MSAGEPPAPTLQFGDPSGSAGHFSGRGHADRAPHSSLLRTSEPVGHGVPTQTPPRFAKLDFATYDGTEDPLNWLNQCERFFRGQRTLALERTWLASYHLRGAVQTWYYALEQDEGNMPPWERFCKLCLLRFGPPIRGSRLAKLGRLPFTSTVQDFADRFQALACHASGRPLRQWTSGSHPRGRGASGTPGSPDGHVLCPRVRAPRGGHPAGIIVPGRWAATLAGGSRAGSACSGFRGTPRYDRGTPVPPAHLSRATRASPPRVVLQLRRALHARPRLPATLLPGGCRLHSGGRRRRRPGRPSCREGV
ncbi:uncharacterized protein LOC119364509 [Triticum dicoccoides]|uniref:uncharacterized protein LOC119364509 n=1 Tax=Triticum dicoccoides TaxID=85692 RepID=UPI00188DF5F9|nr:uncharacterized protein LOC119364509 [Triticum dicoccoides]